jgi:hypothetical protein
MRRICLIIVLAAVSAPGAALAAPADTGSLAVSDASGSLVVSGGGVIYGHLDQGSLLVLSYRPAVAGSALSVQGASVHSQPGLTTYTGSNIRFLLPSGSYTISLVGTGIDVSAVGHGTVGVSTGTAAPSTPEPVTTTTGTTTTAALPATSSAGGQLAVDGGAPVPFSAVATPTYFGAAAAS